MSEVRGFSSHFLMKTKRGKMYCVPLPNVRAIRVYYSGRTLDITCPSYKPLPDVQRKAIRFRRYVRGFQRRSA